MYSSIPVFRVCLGKTMGDTMTVRGRKSAVRWLKGLGMSYAVPLALLACVAAPSVASAQQTFMGVKVNPAPGVYVVTKDVNVRAAPKTASKKIGSLRRGDKVDGVGRPKGSGWLAVRRKNKDLGFVYSPVLMPLIDGVLKSDLSGKTDMSKGRSCDYTVRYIGKTELEQEFFDIADYLVRFECRVQAKKLSFQGQMFITEGPFNRSGKPIYQISVDLLKIDVKAEDVFSTISMYNRAKKAVSFDSISLKGFARKSKLTSVTVQTVAEALDGAVRISLNSWSDKVWAALLKGQQ